MAEGRLVWFRVSRGEPWAEGVRRAEGSGLVSGSPPGPARTRLSQVAGVARTEVSARRGTGCGALTASEFP